MSRQDVEVVRAMVEARKRGDFQAAPQAYDDAVVLDQSRMPAGGIFRGKEGVSDFYTQWFGAWEALEFAIERIVDARDHVVLVIRMTGRGRSSGVDVSIRAADVFTLRDGRIVHHVGYPDAAEALREAGVQD
jgi:ketosteroid isomerase-like protein